MATKAKLIVLFLMSLSYFDCISETITYINTERPCISYFNPKYFTYVKLTSHRYSRKNPVYYVGLHYYSKTTFNNSYLITYISTERPSVTYVNPKYITDVRFISRRLGRRNPVYYVELHYFLKVPFDNNVLMDFYLYEWLTNQYKPSFVEFHYKWCNLIEKDMFFGSAMRQGKLSKPCPHPPGQYDLVNMTINPDVIPPHFPFTRGRIYMNMSHAKTKERIVEGYIDMKIEQLKGKISKEAFSHLSNSSAKN